jgi:hypothetical protein
MSTLLRKLRFAAGYIRRDGLRTDIGKQQTADLLMEAAQEIENLYIKLNEDYDSPVNEEILHGGDYDPEP